MANNKKAKKNPQNKILGILPLATCHISKPLQNLQKHKIDPYSVDRLVCFSTTSSPSSVRKGQRKPMLATQLLLERLHVLFPLYTVIFLNISGPDDLYYFASIWGFCMMLTVQVKPGNLGYPNQILRTEAEFLGSINQRDYHRERAAMQHSNHEDKHTVGTHSFQEPRCIDCRRGQPSNNSC